MRRRLSAVARRHIMNYGLELNCATRRQPNAGQAMCVAVIR